jgi:hypothetical protein
MMLVDLLSQRDGSGCWVVILCIFFVHATLKTCLCFGFGAGGVHGVQQVSECLANLERNNNGNGNDNGNVNVNDNDNNNKNNKNTYKK